MLTLAETETVRAALRYWQEEIAVHQPSLASLYIHESGVQSLTVEQIKELSACFQRAQLRYVLCETHGGVIRSSRLLVEQQLPAAAQSLHPLTVIVR